MLLHWEGGRRKCVVSKRREKCRAWRALRLAWLRATKRSGLFSPPASLSPEWFAPPPILLIARLLKLLHNLPCAMFQKIYLIQASVSRYVWICEEENNGRRCVCIEATNANCVESDPRKASTSKMCHWHGPRGLM